MTINFYKTLVFPSVSYVSSVLRACITKPEIADNRRNYDSVGVL